MTEPNDLTERIRAKLTQDEIDRLQHFDPDAIRALDQAIIDTRMPDESRSNLRILIRNALGDVNTGGAMSEESTHVQRDGLWTYIGQDTWLLQIAPARYLIRSTYRTGGLDGGASLRLLCIESPHNIYEFLHLT